MSKIQGKVEVYVENPDKPSIRMEASSAALYLGDQNNEGDIILYDNKKHESIHLDGGDATLYIGVSVESGHLNDGDLVIRDARGRDSIYLEGGNAEINVGVSGESGGHNSGIIHIRNTDGADTIILDGATGDITLQGADCAEDFFIPDFSEVQPGMVMVIADNLNMRPCEKEYDKRVAGVVSGAGNIHPGVIMGREQKKPISNTRPIALMGRVYCKVDCNYAPVEVGDLLTTSPTMGHAMKAIDSTRAFGSVIGKALAAKKDGQGLIPVLISLQ